MKVKYLTGIGVLGLVLLVSLFSGCTGKSEASSQADAVGTPQDDNSAEFEKDVFRFNEFYKKALVFSSKKDLEATRANLEKAISAWSEIRDTYSSAIPASYSSDSEFLEVLSFVDERLARAMEKVEAGEIEEAHEALEPIRETLFELRQRNGVDYFGDRITKFHEPMEVVYTIGVSKTPETLTPESIKIIEEKLPELVKYLDEIEANKPSDLSEEKSELFDQIVSAERESLNELERALESGDKAEILKACQGIKPNYAKLYLNFG